MKFQAPYIRPLSLARGYRTIYGQVPIRNNHTHKNVFYTVDLHIDMYILDIRFLPFSNNLEPRIELVMGATPLAFPSVMEELRHTALFKDIIQDNGIEPLFLGYEPSVTTLPPILYKMRVSWTLS